MQDSRINYVVVGTFVTAMVVAFVVALSLLAGRSGATDSYFTVYDNVTGIKYGTAVLYEGYQIGEVDKVEPTPSSPNQQGGKSLLFRVTMKIARGWRIPEDSVARAAAGGLLSAMTIDIRGGQSDKMIQPGGEIKGISSSNFFATLSELSAQFGTLNNESIRPLLQSLNNMVQRFDKTTEQNLPAILRDVQTLTGALAKDGPELVASMKHTTQIVERDVLSPENRAHIDQTLANLDAATSNFLKFSSDLDKTRQAINEATETINRVITQNAGNIDESIRDLRYTLGTAARYVDDIAQGAAEASRNLAEFSRQIRDNPGIVLRGQPQPDDAQPKKK
jgi:phospholipid/cholesterol/gamma-HCH transport system substrate-binding protein